jgi:hypothetical protein
MNAKNGGRFFDSCFVFSVSFNRVLVGGDIFAHVVLSDQFEYDATLHKKRLCCKEHFNEKRAVFLLCVFVFVFIRLAEKNAPRFVLSQRSNTASVLNAV